MNLKRMFKIGVVVSTLVLVSCQKHENQDLSIEAFKREVIALNFESNILYLKKAMNEKDITKIRFIIDEIVFNTEKIYSKYTEEKVLNYCKILIDNERANEKLPHIEGDKCHRNADGTVNADDCNFWEKILVSFASARLCDKPSGVGVTTGEINAYYDCVQERVCKNC